MEFDKTAYERITQRWHVAGCVSLIGTLLTLPSLLMSAWISKHPSFLEASLIAIVFAMLATISFVIASHRYRALRQEEYIIDLEHKLQLKEQLLHDLATSVRPNNQPIDQPITYDDRVIPFHRR